jgi:hypothetical protein
VRVQSSFLLLAVALQFAVSAHASRVLPVRMDGDVIVADRLTLPKPAGFKWMENMSAETYRRPWIGGGWPFVSVVAFSTTGEGVASLWIGNPQLRSGREPGALLDEEWARQTADSRVDGLADSTLTVVGRAVAMRTALITKWSSATVSGETERLGVLLVDRGDSDQAVVLRAQPADTARWQALVVALQQATVDDPHTCRGTSRDPLAMLAPADAAPMRVARIVGQPATTAARDVLLSVDAPRARLGDLLRAIAHEAGFDVAMEHDLDGIPVSLHVERRTASFIVGLLIPAEGLSGSTRAARASVEPRPRLVASSENGVVIVNRPSTEPTVATVLHLGDAATAQQLFPFVCASLLTERGWARVARDEIVVNDLANDQDPRQLERMIGRIRASLTPRPGAPASCHGSDDAGSRAVSSSDAQSLAVRNAGARSGAETRVTVDAPRTRLGDVAVALAASAGFDVVVVPPFASLAVSVSATDEPASTVLRRLPGTARRSKDGVLVLGGDNLFDPLPLQSRAMRLRDPDAVRAAWATVCDSLGPRGSAAVVGDTLLVEDSAEYNDDLDAVLTRLSARVDE